MVHKGRKGTRAVSIEMDERQRAELLKLAGESTLTGAIHEALADFILRERVDAPLRKRRQEEREWVRRMGLGQYRGPRDESLG
jgi:hypothetical protein